MWELYCLCVAGERLDRVPGALVVWWSGGLVAGEVGTNGGGLAGMAE